MEIAKYNRDPEFIRQMFDDVPVSGLSGSEVDKLASTLISEGGLAYRYPEAAVKFSEYAIKKESENGGCINTYARLVYVLGDIDSALNWQGKAVKLDPNNKTYKDNLNYYLSIKKIRAGSKR